VTNFGRFANRDRVQRFELSNCNFGDANIPSYYYFIYIFYHVFLSCADYVELQAKFVVGLRLKSDQEAPDIHYLKSDSDNLFNLRSIALHRPPPLHPR
jgi:hypothetical protein